MSSFTRKATLGAATRSVAISACLVLAALVVADSALAQQPTLKEVIGGEKKQEQVTEQPEQKKTQPTSPADAFNRGIPRSSVQGFFQAAGERDFERAAQYLDLRRLPRGLDKSEGP